MRTLFPVDRRREIFALTGLRALAAWWVVGFHFARDLVPGWPLGRLLSAGHVAVDLFFVLSGFVLAHRYGAADVAAGRRRGFFVRRFARVYPMYLASLAVGFAAEWPRSLHDLATTRGLVRLGLQLALLNAWSHRAMFRLNWAAWSLSVEAAMYLLFPWVRTSLERLSSRALVVVLALCWAALFVAPALYGMLDPDSLGRPFALGDEVLWGWYLKFFPVQRLPEFVAGVAAALLVRRRGVPERVASAGPWIAGALFVGTLLLGRVPYAYLHSGVLLPFVLALVALLAVPSGAARALSARPLVALGRASYATYILHVPCFLVAARFWPALWREGAPVLVYVLLLALMSLAAYRWIEEPTRRSLVRRLSPSA